MVFSVVTYGYESWTIKKAEHQRIEAFKLCCWKRLLRVPWTAGRSNQQSWRKSTLNIHWKDWCWSWNSNTLATWGEEPTHWERPWYWERLRAGGQGGNRGWDGYRLNGHDFEPTLGHSERQGSLACCSPWGRKELDMTERLNNLWLNPLICFWFLSPSLISSLLFFLASCISGLLFAFLLNFQEPVNKWQFEVSGRKCSSSTHETWTMVSMTSFINPLGQAYIRLDLLWLHPISTWVYIYFSHFSVFVFHLLRNMD